MLSSGVPGWAGLSAGGIKTLILPPLPAAATVTIVADNDPVGLAAARTAARRWKAEGRDARIAIPPPPFLDWNDAVLNEGGQ
jgi:putative DNA primase/helicase